MVNDTALIQNISIHALRGRRWRMLSAALLFCAAGLALASPERARHPDPSGENQRCLRCHKMETLAYRDPTSGALVQLTIAPAALAASVHGKLACSDCHSPAYRRYPHPADARAERLDCIGCHRDDPERTMYLFPVIEREYRASIHATSTKPAAAHFSCHACHDPHAFRVSKVGKALPEIVADGNRVCLSCHGELRDPLQAAHDWLPNRERHWAAVRCLDCHTPVTSEAGGRVSHQVLAAKDSQVACVGCHSTERRLLERLYAYRSAEDLARSGWLSKAVFNEAYVVGMSRSPLIDRIALSLLGLVAVGLAAHGYGRYRAYQRCGKG